MDPWQRVKKCSVRQRSTVVRGMKKVPRMHRNGVGVFDSSGSGSPHIPNKERRTLMSRWIFFVFCLGCVCPEGQLLAQTSFSRYYCRVPVWYVQYSSQQDLGYNSLSWKSLGAVPVDVSFCWHVCDKAIPRFAIFFFFFCQLYTNKIS